MHFYETGAAGHRAKQVARAGLFKNDELPPGVYSSGFLCSILHPGRQGRPIMLLVFVNDKVADDEFTERIHKCTVQAGAVA
ncbi:MAG: hypothetical protein KatS3mg032_1331 [Cyclobacteriaceae bacterium]|nr:MAG: hypothetical protein KatS3mg032_1331 [Cyclobacteriaceae bacterium]